MIQNGSRPKLNKTSPESRSSSLHVIFVTLVIVLVTLQVLFGAASAIEAHKPAPLRKHRRSLRRNVTSYESETAHLQTPSGHNHTRDSLPTYYNFIKLSETDETRKSLDPSANNRTSTPGSKGKLNSRTPSAKSKESSKKETLDRRDNEPEMETMDVLIEVLNAANKRLIEQREKLNYRVDKQANQTEPKADFSVTTPNGVNKINSNSSSTSLSRTKNIEGENPSPRATLIHQQEQQRADSSAISQTEIRNITRTASSDDRETVRPPKRGKNSTTSTKVNSKPDQNNSTSARRFDDGTALNLNKTRKRFDKGSTKRQRDFKSSGRASQAGVRDHDSVKPGFDPDDAIAGDQSNVARDRGGRLGRDASTNDIGGQYPSTLPPGPLMATPMDHPLMGMMPGARVNEEPQIEDAQAALMRGHRPIVAHDLLYVRPQQRRQHQQRPAVFDQSGDMFAPYRQPQVELMGNGPLYESQMQPGATPMSLLQRQQLIYGQDPYSSSHLGPQARPPLELLSNNQIDEVSEHNKANQQLKSDDWSTSNQDKPHGDEVFPAGLTEEFRGPGAKQQQHQRMPVVQPFGGHTLLGPLLASDKHRGGQDLNNRFGDVNQIGGPHVSGNPLLVNPLQHLMEAARNQQAAALSYERRRLNYELELQKREDEMRRQHEANLARQRAAAEAANQQQRQPDANNEQGPQQQQEQPEQQQQGENENNNQIGGNEQQNQDGNQEQQPNEDENQGQQNNNQQDSNDPDMKSFQNFGESDFTDLFPPGILSPSEIDDMRKQQQEQKQQEEQKQRQEQEEQEQQQAGGEGSSDGSGDDQQGQQQPKGEAAGPNGSDQQQQRQESNEVGATNATSELTEKRKSPQAAEHEKNSTEVQKQTIKTQTNNEMLQANSIRSPLPNNLPSFMFKNVSMPTNQTNSSKRRRSPGQPLVNQQQQLLMQQPLLMLDSDYHDRYVKPFLGSLAGQQARRQEQSARTTSTTTESFMEDNSHDKSPDENKRDANTVPLIDFDDLLENYYSSFGTS